LTAQVQNNFVPELKIKQMQNHNMLKITFDYVFSKLEDNMIDWILNNELKKDEKIEILSSLSEYRLKQILFNAGLKTEYLETI
jgi:ribose 5-phosphate isomerase RpiB